MFSNIFELFEDSAAPWSAALAAFSASLRSWNVYLWTTYIDDLAELLMEPSVFMTPMINPQ